MKCLTDPQRRLHFGVALRLGRLISCVRPSHHRRSQSQALTIKLRPRLDSLAELAWSHPSLLT
jgi:hypothetical protein